MNSEEVLARRTKEDAEATRTALLDAAETVFCSKGVSQSSLNDIAREAGTSRGAVYWHFKDKRDLFHAVIDRVTLPLEEVAYTNVLEVGLELGGSVRSMVQGILRAIQNDQRAVKTFQILVSKVEFVGELEVVQQRMLGSAKRFESHIQAMLEASYCVPAAYAQEAALVIRCQIDGLLRSWLARQCSFDLCATGLSALNCYLQGWVLSLEGIELRKSGKVVRQ